MDSFDHVLEPGTGVGEGLALFGQHVELVDGSEGFAGELADPVFAPVAAPLLHVVEADDGGDSE